MRKTEAKGPCSEGAGMAESGSRVLNEDKFEERSLSLETRDRVLPGGQKGLLFKLIGVIFEYGIEI
jgi:hypothetical protein